MWGAIKNDLLDFVTTITDDTTKTLNKVLGDEEDEEDITVQEKLVADLRRSFETYDSPIREADAAEYGKFRKKFSLSAVGGEIAQVLDQEPEVSRFYTELVPLKLTAEEFWARLFFRVHLIYKSGGAPNLEDDDEEELTWDEDEEQAPPTDSPKNIDKSALTNESASATVASNEVSTKHDGSIDVRDAETSTVVASLNSSSSQTTAALTLSAGTNTASTHCVQKGQQTDVVVESNPDSLKSKHHEQVVLRLQQRVELLEDENSQLITERDAMKKRIKELESTIAEQAEQLQVYSEASKSTPSPLLVSKQVSRDDSVEEQQQAKSVVKPPHVAGTAHDYQSILSEHSEESNVIVEKKGATFSAETEKYLAALDDPEDEEDGWD